MAGIGYGSAICLSVHVKSVPIHIVEFASMIFPRLPPSHPHGCNYVRSFLFHGTTCFSLIFHLSDITRDKSNRNLIKKYNY